MRIYKIIISSFLIASSIIFQGFSQPNLTMKLVNGQWFDGQSFTRKTVWVTNGLLSFKAPKSSVDTTINLADKYVIPPFAEAHNHNLESRYGLQKRIDSYLKNGVFYVKILSSIKKRIDPLMHHYNKPTGLDVRQPYAPLTGSGGHPMAVRKYYLQKGYFRGMFKTLGDIASHGYYIIDNRKDLNRKWKQICSSNPDFIKLMLLHSEEYKKRKDDTTYFGHKGLNPKLVAKIVKKAHRKNLRVSAHVATAYDFHVAVKAGVDEIAHLPEIHNGKLINLKDVRLARKKGIVVVTTVSLVKKNVRKPHYKALLANVRANLRLLKQEGVILAVGSDMYFDNSVKEFQILCDLKVFTNLELLKMWCENAAITTLPHRKIGYLKNGYEASFLVLNKNPLQNIRGINQTIGLRVKRGVILR